MFKILALTLVLSTIGAIASEMYIPSMPYITAWFHVDDRLVQYSFTAYMIGSLVPALFFGSLADIYGRKRIILITLSIGLLGTLGCLFSTGIFLFILSRFIQGFGFSSTNGIGRALLRDYYKGAEFAKYSSYLSMAFSLSVDITPFLGGVLQKFFNWHAIFVFLALFNIFALVVANKFPFKPTISENKFNLKIMLRSYFVITKDRQFIQYSIIGALTYSIFICYLSIAAFLWETRLKLSPDAFGFITLVLSSCYVAGCFLNSRIIRFGVRRVLVIGLITIIFAGMLLVLFTALGLVSVVTFFIVVGLVFIGSGMVFANASALAMSSIRENFSSASALYSFMSVLAAAGFSAIINLFSATHMLPLAVTVVTLAGSSLIIQYLSNRFSWVNYAK